MSAPHKSLAAALSAAQGELQNPPKTKTATIHGFSKKTKKPYTMKYSYADLADVLDGCRGILSKHGLCVMQMPAWEAGVCSVETVLMHSSQEGSIRGTVSCQSSGDPQSVGGAITYLRRYGLAAMIGVAPDADADARDVDQPDQQIRPSQQAPRAQQPPSTIDQIRRALASRAGCTTPEQARCVVRYAAGSGGPTLDDCKASEDAAQVIWEALNSLSEQMPWREFVSAARHAEANNWED